MADIKLRSLKGSPLTHQEVDSNFRQFLNSASISTDGTTLSLFNSASIGSMLDIPLAPAGGVEYSLQFRSGSGIGGSESLTYNPITSTLLLTGSMLIDGTITAQQFHTQYVSSSIIFESGSTLFGNTLDDIHSFTGSLNVSGSLNVEGPASISGTITAPTFSGELDGNASTSTSASHAVNSDTASYIDYSNVANHPSYGDSDVITLLNGNVSTSITPDADETYDLGSADFKWRELHLAQNTIYLGTKSLSVDSSGKVLVDGTENVPTLAVTASHVLYANVKGRPDIHNNTITIQAGDGLIDGGSFTTNSPTTASIVLTVDTGSSHLRDAIVATTVDNATSASQASAADTASHALYAEEVDYGNLTGTIPTWNQDTTGTASFALTASYVDATNIRGTASTAASATSASHALEAISSSYALTASYAISASHEITKEVSASYADVAGQVPFSGLTGTIPTWNQDTTGTAANATSASYALTASYIDGASISGEAPTATSASYALEANSSSYAEFAASASISILSSYAVSASSVPYSGLTGLVPTWNQDTTGTAENANTASYVLASNIDGTIANATTASHALYAESAGTATSASYAVTTTTASYAILAGGAGSATTALTASYIDGSNVEGNITGNATSASYAITASFAENVTVQTTVDTASYIEASNIDGTVSNATSSSYAISASYAVSASYEITKEVSSSYADSAGSASYALTASYIEASSISGQAASATTASHALYAESAGTASYIDATNIDGTVFSATTAASATTASHALYAETAGHASTSNTADTASYIDYSNVDNTPSIPADISDLTDNSNLLVHPSTDTGSLLTTASYNPVGDIITFTKGDGSTFAIDIVDNNTNYYITGGTFDNATGDLALTGNNAAAGATINLDGRYLTDLDFTDTTVLSGSSFPNDFTFDSNLTVAGTLTAQQFNTEYITSSVIFESGSTKFGDTSDDVHSFTGTVDVTGSLNVTGDITAYHSSDRRLKENIQPISSPIEKVKQIGGYEYDWNNNQTAHTGHDIGVIAQEIEKILPELVTTRDNGYKAVRYEKIVALLIEAIKEQQLQIDELKSKL